MRLHELHSAPHSRQARKRIGRGIAAGQGKTAGRGQKGQFARSSPNLPTGFEGGQMPLAQRLPKLRGFHNRFRLNWATVNVSKLNRYEAQSQVDIDVLRASGLVKGRHHGVKVLGAGHLDVALHLHVDRITATARQTIEAAGGSVTLADASAADSAQPSSDVSAVEAPAAGTGDTDSADAPTPQSSD